MRSSHKAYRSPTSLLLYFGLNLQDYWHIDYKMYEAEYDKRHYFWDISPKALLYEGDFDQNGICLYTGVDGKQYYNVTHLAQYALAAYEVFLNTKDKEYLKAFLHNCDWLVNNQTNFKQCEGVWLNEFNVPLYKLESPWISCLGQAFGISALTRAFVETKDDKYLHAAQKAIISFSVNVEQGGVFLESPIVCLEEYTTRTPSLVLNGYISALWAIFDLHQCSGDKQYLNLFEYHISHLKNNISKWDYCFWSKYDLWDQHNFLSSYFYHNLHIKQLRILYRLTNEEVFNKFANKWEKYQKNPLNALLALGYKIYARLVK